MWRGAGLVGKRALSHAYEYLVEKFDDDGKKGGEFRTPHGVVQLLVELLEPREGMRICDPTADSGGMLVECATYVRSHGGERNQQQQPADGIARMPRTHNRPRRSHGSKGYGNRKVRHQRVLSDGRDQEVLDENEDHCQAHDNGPEEPG